MPVTTPPGKAGAAPAPPTVLDLVSGWRWFSYVPPEAQQWLAGQATVARMASALAPDYAARP